MCSLGEALDAPARGGRSFARATRDALVYTCKHLNLDLDEATCAVPCRGWGDGLPRCVDPFGHFIEKI
jgi:hypothetical protein